MYNPQLTVDRIREMREVKGISLTELNEACGLNRNTIAVSANSKTGLSAKILTNISEILGCSVDYLLGKTDEPNPEICQNITAGDNNSGSNNISVGTKSAEALSEPTDTMTRKFFDVFVHLDFAQQVNVMKYALEQAEKSA